MEDREDAQQKAVEVRTKDRSGTVKDDRKLDQSTTNEKTQFFDTKKRESNRPYRPELNHEGKIKVKNINNSPRNEETSFSGNLKSSSTILKPQRGVSNVAGGTKGKSKWAKEQELRNNAREIQQYSGDLKQSSSIVKRGRIGTNYSGRQAKGQSQQSKDKDFRAISLEAHQYSGNIKVVKWKQGKEGNYSGRIKVPSLSTKTKHLKKLSREMNQFEGSIKIKKSREKDLHPSVSYLEGRSKNSREQKEKLRKRKVSWFRFRKNSDQPKSVKEKPEKPKYDSREAEIWYE